MTFCGQCGFLLPSNVTTCPRCGLAVTSFGESEGQNTYASTTIVPDLAKTELSRNSSRSRPDLVQEPNQFAGNNSQTQRGSSPNYVPGSAFPTVPGRTPPPILPQKRMGRGTLLVILLILFLVGGTAVAATAAIFVAGQNQASHRSGGNGSTLQISTPTTLPPTTQAATSTSVLPTPTAVSSPTANGQHPVKVYFSKTDMSNSVVAVNRMSPTDAVGTFAVEQVVAGPTLAEQNRGLFSQLHDSINGPSNCSGQNAIGGSDFLLTLNKKGTVNEQGTATLQFCRAINSSGIGTDSRIQVEVSTTLKQFSTIQKVVILSKDGHCFGDESGQDMCLK